MSFPYFSSIELYSDVSLHTSVQFSHSVVSDSLRPHGLQYTRPSCPSPTPGVYSNSCSLSQWCHPTISFSVISSHPAFNESVLCVRWPKNCSFSFSISPSNDIQDWFPLGWIGWISLQSKGLSKIFSNTTVQQYQFFSTQLSLYSNSHIHTWPQMDLCWQSF